MIWAMTHCDGCNAYISWENGRRTPMYDNKRRIDALLGGE